MRWRVRHAETSLKAFPEKRLAVHSEQDVTGYLERMGQLDRIADWLFVQISVDFALDVRHADEFDHKRETRVG